MNAKCRMASGALHEWSRTDTNAKARDSVAHTQATKDGRITRCKA